MHRKLKRVLIGIGISLIILIFVGIGGTVFYSYNAINNIVKMDFPETPEELGINTSEITTENVDGNVEVKKDLKLRNILLMGIDKEENASDSMMVLTIDNEKKKIKITSIMRDSRVEFGEGFVNKLNYAYNYGGVLNTVKTINQTYFLDITDYIKVDFEDLISIVDILGGVEIKVKENELDYLPGIRKAGTQTLNGEQALAYARIRKVGQYDFERTERQRSILSSLFNKFKDANPTVYPLILSKIAPLIETSFSNEEIKDLITNGMIYGRNGIDQTRIPIDGSWKADTSTGTYYLLWDKDKNLDHLHRFIYEDTTRLSNGK